MLSVRAYVGRSVVEDHVGPAAFQLLADQAPAPESREPHLDPKKEEPRTHSQKLLPNQKNTPHNCQRPPGFSVVMSDCMQVTPGMGLMGASAEDRSPQQCELHSRAPGQVDGDDLRTHLEPHFTSSEP